jgi:membrane protein DedA with SNARE-associated domain
MRWVIVWTILIGFVLVPFFFFESQFNAFAARMTGGGTATWLAAVSILGLLALDVILPVPSSIVSTAAGVLLGVGAGAAVVWTGMTVACLMGYALGSRASTVARRFVGNDGLRRAESLMTRYGDYTIVLCRPVPVLAEASVIFAGIIRAPFGRFLLLSGLSNLGVAIGYAAFGAFSMRIDSFVVAFLGALLLPGIAILVARLTFGRGHEPSRR